MGFYQIAGWAGLCMVLEAGPVQAGQCGYPYCWGALSISDFGAAGWASGLRSAPEAAARAMSQCGARCDTFEVFMNSCAAFAEDSTQLRAFFWADSREKAEGGEMAACRSTGKGCKIRSWACSK